MKLFDRFLIVDAILRSGNTSILIEFKRRSGSLSAYPTVILEKLKYDGLKRASTLFEPSAFYISEYDDGVLIYQPDFVNEKDVDYLYAKVSNGSSYIVKRRHYHLPELNADIVIRKRTTKDQLEEYIIKKIKAS